MAKPTGDREAFLAAEEAKLATEIAAKQRRLRLKRQKRLEIVAAKHQHACYLLGQLVDEAGLAEVPQQDLVRALQQLAAFATDRVVWGHFIHGDITREWIGPSRTSVIVDAIQEARDAAD